MIGVRADLGSLIRPRHDLDAVVEHTGEQRLLVLQRLEVLRLRRRLNVPRAGVAAVDRFFRDDRFEPRHRLAGDVEELPRTRLAKTIDERRRIEFETGENLAAVARARAGADAVAFEHQDGRAGPRQMTCRRQTGVAGADDDDIRARGDYDAFCWGSGLGAGYWQITKRIPPVWILFHERGATNTDITPATRMRPRCIGVFYPAASCSPSPEYPAFRACRTRERRCLIVPARRTIS